MRSDALGVKWNGLALAASYALGTLGSMIPGAAPDFMVRCCTKSQCCLSAVFVVFFFFVHIFRWGHSFDALEPHAPQTEYGHWILFVSCGYISVLILLMSVARRVWVTMAAFLFYSLFYYFGISFSLARISQTYGSVECARLWKD